jgi:P27 family predicted phage terminase small subunit
LGSFESPLCKTDKCPNPPKFLDKIALQEWGRISSALFEAGLLSEIDVSAFAGYCQAWSRHVKAEQILETQELLIPGSRPGILIKNPLIAISNMALEQALKSAKEFGMSPASRSKVARMKAKTKDAWDNF